MKTLKRPGVLAGLFVGLMLTLAITVIFYLGWKLMGLPFVPFDVFDWMTRVLPGQVIASGIDAMVKVIRSLNLGPTAATAKLAEQSMAVVGMIFAGAIVGAIFFAVERILRGHFASVLGPAFGLAAGVPIMLLSLHLNKTPEIPPWISAAWILLVFFAWGVAIARANQRLFATAGAAEDSAEQASVKRIDRRRFLVRLGGATALITVTGAMVGRLSRTGMRQSALPKESLWSSTHPLPNADAEVKPVPGTRPEFTPLERHYRIDINTIPPTIDESQWKLKVKGLVEKPIELTLAEIRSHEPMHQFITLACISNPVGGDLIGTTRWTGVSLQKLLPIWQLKPNATHLKIHSADGFYEVVSLETIKADERVMFAYEWDGVPLLAEHGFPLRIYVPNTYGMKLPKWIESIEATDHWEPGYWVERGWDKIAQMKATSVIDTVGVNMNIVGADARTIVPIGGIAHAGSRGISKVEVQVDDGPWQEAALRTPLSQLTWVIWRYEWPFQRGKHTFTVRCFDGTGAMQSPIPTPMEPDGAAGLHSKTQMF